MDLQGWYRDPFGRHEARYFSGGEPTKLVRDGDVESYDDPPASRGWAPPEQIDVAAPSGPAAVASSAPARTRRRTGRTAALAGTSLVGLAAVVAFASAGGGTTDAPGTVSTLAAYHATVAAASATISSTVSLTTGDPRVGLAVESSGAYSWAADQGDITSHISGSFAGAGTTGTIETIYDHGVYYTRFSTGGPDVPSPAAAWTETVWDTQGGGGGLQGVLGAIAGLVSSRVEDPGDLLAVLAHDSTSVTRVGEQTIDGTATVHLRASFSVSSLAPAASPADLQAAEQALGTDSIDIDYWVDSSDRLRRMHFSLDIQRQPTGPTTTDSGEQIPLFRYPITYASTLDLSDYGAPVFITPPLPAQITAITHCTAAKDGFECSDQ